MILDLTYGCGEMCRTLGIDPDVKNNLKQGGFDWSFIPYEDNYFDMVLFDPPHIILREQNLGASGKLYRNLAEKYGHYETSIEAKIAITKAFDEIMRVLKPNGICIFKWCNIRMALSTIEKLIPSEFKIDDIKIQANGGKRIGKYKTVYYYLRLSHLPKPEGMGMVTTTLKGKED